MESFRKAYGALKDSTKVGLAKVNSDFKVSFGKGEHIRLHKHMHESRLIYMFGFIGFLDRLYVKDLDISIVKATNHVERPPKERYVRSECSTIYFKLYIWFHNMQIKTRFM